MADNFDLKKYLVENQLGPFAKAKLNESAAKIALINQVEEMGDTEFEKLLTQAGYEEHWTGDILTTIDTLSDDQIKDLLDDEYDSEQDELTGFGSASGPIDEYEREEVASGVYKNDEGDYEVRNARQLWNMYAKNKSSIGPFAAALKQAGVPAGVASDLAAQYDDQFSKEEWSRKR